MGRKLDCTTGVSRKKGASETFGTDVIFVYGSSIYTTYGSMHRCSSTYRIVLKVSSYSQENSLPEHVKSVYMTYTY